MKPKTCANHELLMTGNHSSLLSNLGRYPAISPSLIFLSLAFRITKSFLVPKKFAT